MSFNVEPLLQFHRFGHVTHGVVDREEMKSLIYYDTIEEAQRACNEMRARVISGSKIMVSRMVVMKAFI